MPPTAKFLDAGPLGLYFESLDDLRHTRKRKHLLADIAVIAVCGVICGCDVPTAIHRWAKHRASWLAQHLALPNGIPSREGLALGEGDRVRGADHPACRRHGVGRGAL
jgi:hypothetical protein